VREQALKVLNAYLQAQLGHSLVLPDAGLLARQQANFQAEFGPQRLEELRESDLLRHLPYNATDDRPMDYWLEFRRDGVFDQRLFGSIAGGSATKFGTWQDKKTGHWRVKPPGSCAILEISEEQALAIVAERRAEMLAAVQTLQAFVGRPVWEIDPHEVQAALEAAAPRWKHSAWLHKYLHLHFPELITWRATLPYLQAELYRLGEEVGGLGMYACDLRIIQFWSSLPALTEVPVALRYRLGQILQPRDHWCLVVEGEAEVREEMLNAGTLALGPARVESLAGVFSLTSIKEVRRGLEIALANAGVLETRCLQELLSLGQALKAGSLVALLSDPATVVAVGEVKGAYRYAVHSLRSHQVQVKWLHRGGFTLPSAVEVADSSLVALDPQNPLVAELEAWLLANGVAPWPGFDRLIPGPRLPAKPLEPPQGLLAQLLDMVERKKQVVFYGPPGTGKTHYAERVALEMVVRHNFGCLPQGLSAQQWDRIYGRDGSDPLIAMCTFHPVYGYEDFIEGYRPTAQGFRLTPGLFKRLVTAAQSQPDSYFVLIIDEINRGNIPRIFGELITLLELGQRGCRHAFLPLSGDPFTVPMNLYLIATMNTADRSIQLLDTALRRRFGFREFMPRPELLQTCCLGRFTLSAWLRALNRRIRAQLGDEGRNLQVGHAYFMQKGQPITALQGIAEILCEDIWPLLQEYCYEDPRALAAILASDKGGIYDPGTADLRHELLEPDREKELIEALGAIVTPEDWDSAPEEEMLATVSEPGTT
jgi:5-methylcytosine-specific restriction protein B